MLYAQFKSCARGKGLLAAMIGETVRGEVVKLFIHADLIMY